MRIIIIISLCLVLIGCATAWKSEDGRKLAITSAFGAKAKFPDGSEIESKGLPSLPDMQFEYE